jgi:hypothetical protein
MFLSAYVPAGNKKLGAPSFSNLKQRSSPAACSRLRTSSSLGGPSIGSLLVRPWTRQEPLPVVLILHISSHSAWESLIISVRFRCFRKVWPTVSWPYDCPSVFRLINLGSKISRERLSHVCASQFRAVNGTKMVTANLRGGNNINVSKLQDPKMLLASLENTQLSLRWVSVFCKTIWRSRKFYIFQFHDSK